MRPLALAAAAALALGCGGGGESDGSGGTAGTSGSAGAAAGGSGGSTGGAAGAPGECMGTPVADGPPDASGTWALQRVTPRQAFPPAFADPIVSQTVEHIVLEQTQSGTEVSATGEMCFRDQIEPPMALVDIVVPQRFIDAMSPIVYTGTYEQVDGAWRYRVPDYWELEAVTLTDPDNEDLPSTPDDPRLVDIDGDGNPGATIVIRGVLQGELYASIKSRYGLDGAAVSADRIDGRIDFFTTNITVSSDPPNLKDLTVSDFADPDLCASFTLVKIPDGSDCQFVRDNSDQLFP